MNLVHAKLRWVLPWNWKPVRSEVAFTRRGRWGHLRLVTKEQLRRYRRH
ncbi:hypothetical protein HMPREF0321_1810 [Dermacoccus sp. Ellin185]|nr:hypothetical protein HMPREF0321_1810 [Dermacoccus sp. Ellin185]